MPWVYLDDHIDEHPKVIAAGDPAFGFWVRMLAYCRRNLTAGRVPKTWGGFRGEKIKIRRLIAVGLVEEIDSDTYAIHDYEVWNHSEEKSKKARDAARKRWASRRKDDADAHADASPPNHAEAYADAMPSHMQTQSERICQTDAHTRAGAHPLPHTPSTRSSSTNGGRADRSSDDDDQRDERTPQAGGESGEAGEPRPSPAENNSGHPSGSGVLAEVWTLIADAELASRVAEKGPVGQPAEWLKRARWWAADRHADTGAALVDEHPDWPAHRIAAVLEPARFVDDAAARRERLRAAARAWGARMAGVLTEDELVDDAQRHYAASPEAQVDALDAWREATEKHVSQGAQ